ncbi:hypothetical protein HMPREF9999_00944 [Alloprevotella sp. oral taxon 473 str. F0040]|nr:hypothetical protein HMPREF9999_00944 [Alloprevotella sp. oral taxon 473 str. F0040]
MSSYLLLKAKYVSDMGGRYVNSLMMLQQKKWRIPPKWNAPYIGF